MKNHIILSSVVRTRIVCQIIFILVCTFSLSTSLLATTYYVATNGNDASPGSENQPWRTIQKAANTLIAGDIVYIKTGTYNERVIPKNSGTAGNYILYAAYSGDQVTLDGNGIFFPTDPTDLGGLFEIDNKGYIRVSGLRVINAQPYDNNCGILVNNSKNIIIEKNYTYNTASSGIGVWNAENIIIDGNEVELACNDGEQECITVAVTNVFEIKNNKVHNGGPGSIGGEGIDVKDGSSNGKVFNNLVYDIPYRLGIYLEAWDKHTYDIEIYNNIIHDCGDNGITIASEMGGLLENITIFNNVIYNNKYTGIAVTPNGDVPNPPMKNISIINNTIYNNGWNIGDEPWGGGIGADNPNLSSLIIRNNIVSQNLLFQIAIEYYKDNFSIDHNLIDGFRGDLSEELRGNDYVEGDPLFVNSSGADFHLQGNSPAIDKGSALQAPTTDFDKNSRPTGAGIDIGAFEFGSTSEVSNGYGNSIKSFSLKQNYPNPFNPSTTIRYSIPSVISTTEGRRNLGDFSSQAPRNDNMHVTLKVYDILGRVITVLVNKTQKPGNYQIQFNAGELTNGIYFYRLQFADFTQSKKMILLK